MTAVSVLLFDLHAKQPSLNPSAVSWQVLDLPKRTISPRLLLQLRSYCEALLTGGYNMLMTHLRKELEPGIGISRLEEGDFIKFLHLAGWFTQYVKVKQVGLFAAFP